jgi:class 3 adenylate cyclase
MTSPVQPEVRYATAGESKIAFQVVGEGDQDLVVSPGFVSHLDLMWTDPDWVRAIRRLASFSRVILFDKRGTGLSDPTSSVPTLEERVDEVRAVMDAADSKRAALFGFSEGAAMSLMFAATYPDRVSALALFGSLVTGTPEPGTVPWAGACVAAYDALEDVVNHWGEGRLLSFMAPNVRQNELGRRLTGVFERTSASPAMAHALVEGMRRLDIADILPAVKAPTLVLHRSGEVWPVEAARDLAERIPGARYVELEGADHWWWVGNVDEVLGEIEEFITGIRQAPRSDRVLATVMFTDIVGSTKIAAELGDLAWRGVLERHDRLVRDEVARYRGRVVKSIGDGYLATFDGPARGVECAKAILRGAEDLSLELRAGLHTGECELIENDVGGMAVHIGARVSAQASPGEILASSTVRDIVVGSDLRFIDRGLHELKGVPGEWRLYAAARGPETDTRPSTARQPEAPDRPPTWQRAVAVIAGRQPRLAQKFVALSRREARRSG